MPASWTSAEQPRVRRIPRRWPGLLMMALATTLLMGADRCPHFDRWSRTDEFVAQLRCGMTVTEVGQVVARYRGLRMRQIEGSSQGWNLIADKGETRIRMKLDGPGLRWVRVSWTDSIMHAAVLPEVDLCAPRVPSDSESTESVETTPTAPR